MHPFLEQHKPQCQSVLEHLQEEISHLRTGRASPSMVDNVMVEAYGAPMSIKGVASITTSDARTLTIEPWDKSLLKAIEKAVQAADLGAHPIVDGSCVRLSMPQMTEDGRKQIVKRLKELLEESRVRLRGVREKLREELLRMEKEKALSEDEKFKALDELDKLTKEFIGQMEALAQRKEEELMTL